MPLLQRRELLQRQRVDLAELVELALRLPARFSCASRPYSTASCPSSAPGTAMPGRTRRPAHPPRPRTPPGRAPAICSSCSCRVARAIWAPCALSTTFSSASAGPGSWPAPPSARRPGPCAPPRPPDDRRPPPRRCSILASAMRAPSPQRWRPARPRPGAPPRQRPGRGVPLCHRSRGERVGPAGDGPLAFLDGAYLEPGFHFRAASRDSVVGQLLPVSRTLVRVGSGSAVSVCLGLPPASCSASLALVSLDLGQALLPGPLRRCDGGSQSADLVPAALARPASEPSLPEVSAAAASACCSPAAASVSIWRACASSSSAAASCRSARWHRVSASAERYRWPGRGRRCRLSRLCSPAEPPRAQCAPSASPPVVTTRSRGSAGAPAAAAQTVHHHDIAEQRRDGAASPGGTVTRSSARETGRPDLRRQRPSVGPPGCRGGWRADDQPGLPAFRSRSAAMISTAASTPSTTTEPAAAPSAAAMASCAPSATVSSCASGPSTPPKVPGRAASRPRPRPW